MTDIFNVLFMFRCAMLLAQLKHDNEYNERGLTLHILPLQSCEPHSRYRFHVDRVRRSFLQTSVYR